MRRWRRTLVVGAMLLLAVVAAAVLVVSEHGHADVDPACGTAGTDCAEGR